MVPTKKKCSKIFMWNKDIFAQIALTRDAISSNDRILDGSNMDHSDQGSDNCFELKIWINSHICETCKSF